VSYETAKRIRRRLARTTPIARGSSRTDKADRFPDPDTFAAEYLADYQPHEKQRELADNRHHPRVMLVAGRRAGKTYGGARSHFLPNIADDYQAFRDAGGTWTAPANLSKKTKAALTYWVVAPTHDLTGYPQQEIFEVLGQPEESDLILKWHESESRLWLVGGIRIEFKSADRPERLVAAGLDGVWVEEAARMKAQTWHDNVASTLSDKQGWALFTTTPMGKNWVFDEWQKTQLGRGERSRGWYGLHFKTIDNTAVPALVEEAQRAKRDLPEPIYLRNYAASFEAFRGKVFEAFLDDDTHVVTQIPWSRVVAKFGGLDWGHANPGAQIEIAKTDDGTLYAYREDYQERLTVSPPGGNRHADSWVRRLSRAAGIRGVSRWWADPSQPDHIQTCRSHTDTDGERLDVRPANNAVAPGIEALAALLEPVAPPEGGPSRPALYLHRSCANLRRELSSYRYRDDNTEKPVKEDDHAVDALRYAVLTEHDDGGGVARLDWSIFADNRSAA